MGETIRVKSQRTLNAIANKQNFILKCNRKSLKGLKIRNACLIYV